MTQMSFSDAEYTGKRKRTRREIFLAEMEQVVPWEAMLALIEPVYPKAGKGRRPYSMDTMLRIHLLQNWYNYSDPAMEEALYEVAPLRHFAGLSLVRGSVPDETTILNFRRLLETHGLAAKIFSTINAYLTEHNLLLREGTIVDATIIHAPSSTNNREKARDPAMHQTKKGQQWYFGMKAHIGVDMQGGLVHTVVSTAANVSDVVEADKLLHGKEVFVCADAGYAGADNRAPKRGRTWAIAAKRGSIKALPEGAWKQGGGRARTSQGLHPGKGGTPLPSDQTAVRVSEGALQGLGQKPRPAADAVCAVQSVDGQASITEHRRGGASMIGPTATEERKKRHSKALSCTKVDVSD